MDECLVVRLEITGNVETKSALVLISKGSFHPENEKTKIIICNFISQNSFNGANSESVITPQRHVDSIRAMPVIREPG